MQIAEIVQLPDATVVNEVTGVLAVTFDKKNPKAPAKGVLKDPATGAEIRIDAWGHPDLAPMRGTTVTIRDDQGGMKKQTGEYNGQHYPLLNLNKTSIFSTSQQQHAAPAASAPSTHSSTSREDGMRFGMVFKLAGDYYLKNSETSELPHPDDFVTLVTHMAIKLHKAAKDAEKL